MKPIILTMAICIACGVPMATRAYDIDGHVENRYTNGALHTFIATYVDQDDYYVPWEYICSNGFEDMELAFASLTLEFDWDSEEYREGYSYVNDCEITARTCASGKYIYSVKRDDGITEYACADCPAAPNGETVESYSGMDIWNVGDMGGITECYIPSSKTFTDDTGAYKYNNKCYYTK